MATKDQDWTRHGRSQRSITVGGRHFFAQRRCGQGHGGVWTVQEVNQAEVSGSRAIGPWSRHMNVSRLSAYIDAVVEYRAWLKAGAERSDPWGGRFDTEPEAGAAEAAWMAARGFDV